jgi:hypothetical protein
VERTILDPEEEEEVVSQEEDLSRECEVADSPEAAVVDMIPREEDSILGVQGVNPNQEVDTEAGEAILSTITSEVTMTKNSRMEDIPSGQQFPGFRGATTMKRLRKARITAIRLWMATDPGESFAHSELRN